MDSKVPWGRTDDRVIHTYFHLSIYRHPRSGRGDVLGHIIAFTDMLVVAGIVGLLVNGARLITRGRLGS